MDIIAKALVKSMAFHGSSDDLSLYRMIDQVKLLRKAKL